MKKLIAYSSVAHMGVVTIGIFTFNVQGIQGALFQMLSHGIVSGALFLVVGVVYDRIHTRDIARYGGLADRMPLYALTFMIFTMASVGLPGTSGFVGEFLVIVGVAAGELLAGAARCHRHDPGRGLHAVSLSPRGLRPPHQGGSALDPRPLAARDRGVRAADPADAVDGHLSVELQRASGTPAWRRWCSTTPRRSRRRSRWREWCTDELGHRAAGDRAVHRRHGDPDLRRAAARRHLLPLQHVRARRLPARRIAGAHRPTAASAITASSSPTRSPAS